MSAMRVLLLISVLGGWWSGAHAAQQDPAQPPASRPVPSNLERLNEMIALVEGQNPPEVRRTVARQILLNEWPETPPRLLATLGSGSGPARVAVAAALAELPQYLDATYIDPLMGMLGDAEAEVRNAAARVLAAYDSRQVVDRLRGQAGDAAQPLRGRLGAVAALGLLTVREAVDSLAGLLADSEPAVSAAALTALQQAAAIDFEDAAAARKWWEESRALPLEAWQQRQIQRLIQKDRESRERLEALESRLVRALEANFQKAPDAERFALLAAYLNDTSGTVRLLGLRLAQLHLAEGKSADALPAEITARIRDLVQSTQPREQAAAVRTLAGLRREEDGALFLSLLGQTRNRQVRLAVLNGLGYVGDAAAIDPLLRVLDEADDDATTEAVAALGRLADRDVPAKEQVQAIAGAFRRVFERTRPAQAALRERVLWAMAILADPTFGPAFAAALDAGEAVAVRQAAVRGLAALGDAKLADALTAAVGDPDRDVRRTVVETLAELGTSDRHLQALWSRTTSPPEGDEGIRQAAWRGVRKLLTKREPAEIEEWISRLPGDGPQHRQRRLELLQALLQTVEQARPIDLARRGAVQARIAAQHAQMEQVDDSLAAYLRAISDLHGADEELAQRTAIELLRFALVSGRYGPPIAEALAAGNPAPDFAGLWQAALAEVEQRLTPDAVDAAVAMLRAVQEHPPGRWPPGIEEQITQTLRRAEQLKNSAKSELETRPSSVAADPKRN